MPTMPTAKLRPIDTVDCLPLKHIPVANRVNTAKVLPTKSTSDLQRRDQGSSTGIECDSHTMLAVAHGGAMQAHAAQSLKRAGGASDNAEVRTVCMRRLSGLNSAFYAQERAVRPWKSGKYLTSWHVSSCVRSRDTKIKKGVQCRQHTPN